MHITWSNVLFPGSGLYSHRFTESCTGTFSHIRSDIPKYASIVRSPLKKVMTHAIYHILYIIFSMPYTQSFPKSLTKEYALSHIGILNMIKGIFFT